MIDASSSRDRLKRREIAKIAGALSMLKGSEYTMAFDVYCRLDRYRSMVDAHGMLSMLCASPQDQAPGLLCM